MKPEEMKEYYVANLRRAIDGAKEEKSCVQLTIHAAQEVLQLVERSKPE